MYIKSKPGRYGIKLWAAADVETSYLLNIQPNTGKLSGNREINQAERVVTDLLTPFYGSGRGVTCDNFFTSLSLASKLLLNNITLTGTIRANKREIPKEMSKSNNREVFSSIFGFSEDFTLVSYVPKKNYAVNLLSTEHHNASLEDSDRKRPHIILHYNQTKGGVDNADKMTQSYTCARPTRRWPLKMFMDMIDIAALNAFVVWTKTHPQWRTHDKSKRQYFLRQLSVELARENVFSRKSKPGNLPMYIRHGFDMFENSNCMDHHSPAELNVTTKKIQSRCFFCPRTKDKKTTTTCYSCKRYICSGHRKLKKLVTCRNCTD